VLELRCGPDAARRNPRRPAALPPPGQTLTKDLVNDALDGHGGVDCNSVFRNVFFRLMQSRNEFPFRRLSAAPLIVRSLVKPPVQCAKVDLKDKSAVK
jgi:hypothetical protein